MINILLKGFLNKANLRLNLMAGCNNTLSHLEDFAKTLLKTREKQKEAFVYLHVFAPYVTGRSSDSSLSIEVCGMAVRTNYFPLWEAEGGKFRLAYDEANPKPIQELTRLVLKFAHLKAKDLHRLQQTVDAKYAFLKALCTIGSSCEKPVYINILEQKLRLV
jgi:pyruvate/2-oxoacid:ferredoxin oxidoreductase beta subunit